MSLVVLVGVTGLPAAQADYDDGGSTIGLILRDTIDRSWICVDLEEADECYRKIVSTSTDPDGIAALLDRLSESIWMSER